MGVLQAIWTFAIVLSVASVLWMSGLIGLRVVHQRQEARRINDRRKLDAALIALLQGRCDLQRDLGPYVRRARLMSEALLDFLGLVRGHDRYIVLQALISLDVPRTLRGRVDRGSLAGRLVCLEALAAFPGPETEEALAAAAESGSAQLRLTALKSLHESRRDLPLGRLLRELETGRLRPSAVVGEFVRNLVAEIPATAAAELRGGRLPEAVQLLLIDGLASAGDYGVIPTLVELAASPSAPVRAAAIRALGALNHPAAEPSVAAGLADVDWAVRAAAAEAAGDIRLGRLADQLAKAMEDEVWRVRFSAAVALMKLGPDGRRGLQIAAVSPVRPAAETAAMALTELGVVT